MACIPCIIIETHCGSSNGEITAMIGEANAMILTNETFAETLKAMDEKGLITPETTTAVLNYCDTTRARVKIIRDQKEQFEQWRDEAYTLLYKLTGVDISKDPVLGKPPHA